MICLSQSEKQAVGRRYSMRRVILIVLDSFGIGGAPDADLFADQGANTLGTIAGFCADRQTHLNIPHMLQLGLGDRKSVV